MYGTLVKLTLRIPDDLHRSLKRLAKQTGRSLNKVIVEVLRRGLSLEVPVRESEYDRTLRVIRESGLLAEPGPLWEEYQDGTPPLSHAELQELLKGVPPLSEIILEDRGPCSR